MRVTNFDGLELRTPLAKGNVGTLDGGNAGTLANASVVGGLPVVHRIDVTAGANGAVNVVLTHKTRVIDAWLVLRGAGVGSAVFTVGAGANAITDGMAASGADTTVVRAGTINDANQVIAAGGQLRVTGSGGATMPDATIYILGVREP